MHSPFQAVHEVFVNVLLFILEYGLLANALIFGAVYAIRLAWWVAERTQYVVERRMGWIPPCTPGNCYCPGALHMRPPEDVQ